MHDSNNLYLFKENSSVVFFIQLDSGTLWPEEKSNVKKPKPHKSVHSDGL